MALDESRTCCFTGHRPDKLPWGLNERDLRCASLKRSLTRELDALDLRGFRHFICGMAMGCDLYFAEAVLALREQHPDLTLEGAIPCLTQPQRWPEHLQLRWRRILDQCDLETVVQQSYDRWCMLRRDRYMVDRSAAVLAVFDGTSGGTHYTLNYAMDSKREILLLDPARPEAKAAHFTI